MKHLLLTLTFLFTCVTVQAATTAANYDHLPHGTKIIAKRLASNNLTEVVVIAMKLQLECQQLSDKDVCDGVRNIVAVLDARIASLPKPIKKKSVAFVQGLRDGVIEANQKSVGIIAQVR